MTIRRFGGHAHNVAFATVNDQDNSFVLFPLFWLADKISALSFFMSDCFANVTDLKILFFECCIVSLPVSNPSSLAIIHFTIFCRLHFQSWTKFSPVLSTNYKIESQGIQGCE